MSTSQQTACCYWLTGLSGAGKSTIACLVSKDLRNHGVQVVELDGDALRTGLNRDLGFSREDRRENIRRIAEVAAVLVNQGVVALVSVISPFREDRNAARALFSPQQFVEVYINTDLQTCIARDTKGLYAQAQANRLANMTGISQAYEPPQNAEIIISTEIDAQRCADKIVGDFLSRLHIAQSQT